jgi:hypothetical protein
MIVLTALGFRSIEFAGSTVWLAEGVSKTDFLKIRDTIPQMLNTGKVPDRYLNPDAYTSYLTLSSLTTAIFNASFRLSTGKGNEPSEEEIDFQKVSGWKNIAEEATTEPMAITEESATPKFVKESDGVLSPWEQSIVKMTVWQSKSAVASAMDSRALINPFTTPARSFLSAGNTSHIVAPGKIFKFDHRLSIPDVNLVGDVIGRYFLTALGPDFETQSTNLQKLKSGLGNLRLLPVGHVFAHMYKCLEISINCHSGCLPIFANHTYEGCVIQGGPGATLIVNGESVEFESEEDLKLEFSTVSTHASAMFSIADIFIKAGEPRADQLWKSKTMFDLRKYTIVSKLSQGDRDAVHQYAALLDFTVEPWVISPFNLDKLFSLIQNPKLLDREYPIGRSALFTNDPIKIAFSCFGEGSCPTWDIPNGKVQKIGENPPASQDTSKREKGSRGDISNADWVMTTRTTDLLSACDDFLSMAKTMSYRSVSSAEAGKRGFRSFSSDRMGVFWRSMVDALKVTNPIGDLGEKTQVGKRKAIDSGEGAAGRGSVKRNRTMML